MPFFGGGEDFNLVSYLGHDGDNSRARQVRAEWQQLLLRAGSPGSDGMDLGCVAAAEV